jgi:transcription elongation GreA/GreB family factor
MSRAFVTERDGDAAGTDLPDRPVSPHPNYVTPTGLETLRRQADELRAERDALAARPEDLSAVARQKTLDRDLRWLAARLASAIVVDPATQPRDVIRFGATVTVVDEDAVLRTFMIVGEDEAEPEAGRVSWVSPLARVVSGARVGDEVVWRRPTGDLVLTVLGIGYSGTGGMNDSCGAGEDRTPGL